TENGSGEPAERPRPQSPRYDASSTPTGARCRVEDETVSPHFMRLWPRVTARGGGVHGRLFTKWVTSHTSGGLFSPIRQVAHLLESLRANATRLRRGDRVEPNHLDLAGTCVFLRKPGVARGCVEGGD